MFVTYFQALIPNLCLVLSLEKDSFIIMFHIFMHFEQSVVLCMSKTVSDREKRF